MKRINMFFAILIASTFFNVAFAQDNPEKENQSALNSHLQSLVDPLDHTAFLLFLSANAGLVPKTIPGKNEREKSEYMIRRIKNWYRAGETKQSSFGPTAENPSLGQVVATWLDYRRNKFEKNANLVNDKIHSISQGSK